jgi:hypothetical protein
MPEDIISVEIEHESFDADFARSRVFSIDVMQFNSREKLEAHLMHIVKSR